jgi:ABC-2 type transport system ATP-binding protein
MHNINKLKLTEEHSLAQSVVMSSPAIETQGLARVYETYKKPDGLWNSVKGFWSREYIQKPALKPTDLFIQGGEIIGLVGGNGAGKTTLLKLLSGLIYPSSGSAKVLGYNPSMRDPAYLRQMSILLGQKNQLWWDIPAADSFQLLGTIYGIAPADVKSRVDELAGLLQCRELLSVQLRRLSLGERMKMEIIGSLLHRPRVLFLDEPTIGLDIIAQTTIREFLADYVEREKPTILLTSHYMDDISRLADRLLLISKGAIVYDGTVEDFTEAAEQKQRLQLTLTHPPATRIELTSEFALEPGQEIVNFELSEKDLAPILQKIMTVSTVQNLKIDEADFEDVIRGFLEKDSRVRETSRTL